MGLKPSSSPCCFISYSWESEEHSNWVRYFSEQLHTSGVYTLLDQWDLFPGSDLPKFMEQSVRESDYVILVCTPTFVQKANEGGGGVGYEKRIITGEIYHNIAKPNKFVPIIRKGDPGRVLPHYLLSKVYIDFRQDNVFNEKLEELLRLMHKIPKYSRPPLGSIPFYNTIKTTMVNQVHNFSYCSRCGALAGEQSTCTGVYTYHDFVSK